MLNASVHAFVWLARSLMYFEYSAFEYFDLRGGRPAQAESGGSLGGGGGSAPRPCDAKGYLCALDVTGPLQPLADSGLSRNCFCDAIC